MYYLVVDNNAGVKCKCHRIIYAFLIQLWIPAWLGHMRDQSFSAWSVIFHGDFLIFQNLMIHSVQNQFKKSLRTVKRQIKSFSNK